MSLSSNGISTRNYTWLSFAPVSLLFQFRSVSNAYFLMTASIMLIPDVSPVSPFSAIAPLCFVLLVSEIRQFAEEYQKYRRDVQTNLSEIKRLIKQEGEQVFETVTWESLHPGDVVLLYDRDNIPADLCVVYTGANNFSYVETSNLDGETNLKTRSAPSVFDRVAPIREGRTGDSPEDYDFSAVLEQKLVFEPPNPDMYRFRGTLGDSTVLSINNVMLRGCSMRNTPWALGVCVYTGHESKAMLNSTSAGMTPSKKTNVERRTNVMVLIVFACQILLVFGSTLGYQNQVDEAGFSAWYLSGLSNFSSGLQSLTFFVLLNTIIPMSLWVSLEVVKFFQASLVEADGAMKDAGRNLSCVAHSKNLNEELGQVTHVFTDKTGTLTCNRMEFKGCAINGKLYSIDDESVANVEIETANRASVTKVGRKRPIKRRDLGFAGAIPIETKLLELIASGIPWTSIEDSNEADFFRCIALCHSCERVAKHNEDEEHKKKAERRRNKGSLFGWLSPSRRTEAENSHPGSPTNRSSPVAEDTIDKKMLRLVNNPGVSTVYPGLASFMLPEDDEEELQASERSLDSIDQKLAKYIYQSTSPDEAALVSSAADIGFFFHKRLQTAVQIDINGVAYVYEMLHQVPFTSDRRMMSVVVRKADSEKVIVFTKGADSSVLPRCAEGGPSAVIDHTQWSVNIFADKGFRTLCLAKREMALAEWAVFEARIKEASANLETREALMTVIDREIESHMTLLGCTGVEDKLQPGVHETVAALRNAGITVCMITGDKRETAINIARSCKLVNSDNNVYTMSTQDNMYGGGNFIHLDSLAQLVGDGRADPLWGMTTEGNNASGSQEKRSHSLPSADSPTGLIRRDSLPLEEKPEAGIYYNKNASGVSLSPLATEARIAAYIAGKPGVLPLPSEGPSPVDSRRISPSQSTVGKDNNKFCIVLDGAALSIVLANPNQTRKLLSVMAHPQCEAAVFCRVNPKQKGLIVKSCRDRLTSGCVLAIGDGANDISMIKEAHVGIGIFGEEGWQAAGSADYAITKFKDLYRLLFIHGRWNYLRITFFISFFMYKNYAFTFLQFWMAAFSQWTGLSVLDDYCLLAFNSIFMVGPLFAACLFDKDIHPDADRPSKRKLLHPRSVNDEKWYVNVIPKLYGPGQRNEYFKSQRVVAWLVLGLIHSVCIFFSIMAAWALYENVAIQADGKNASFSMEQQAIYTILLMSLSAVHTMMVKEWNVIYAIGSIVVHILLYIIFVAIYDVLYLQPYSYIAAATFSNWNFWFLFALVVALCVLPVILLSRFKELLRPGLADLIKSKRLTERQRKGSMAELAHIRCDSSELTGM